MGKPSINSVITGILSVGIIFGVLCTLVWGGLSNSAYLLLFIAAFILHITWSRKARQFLNGVCRITGLPLAIEDDASAAASIHELELLHRRSQALIPELIEGTLQSSTELAHALNRIAETAIKTMGYESAELALFDKEDGRYHSSIVLGRPFRGSIDEHLAGSGREPRPVHLEPISFAGKVLGALRVALRPDQEFSVESKAVLKVLGLQAAVAIVNADFLKELLKMREHSQASQKARTGFLANLSHELRGPLGIVLNASELLREELCGPLNDEQKETLLMIQKNGAHLLDLVSDVLDFARIESGKVTAQPASISTRELFIDIAAVVRAQADSKRHRIVVEERTELFLLCDRRHVRQILINLLTNAIKYTPDGGEIRLWAEMFRGGKVKICVRDSGVGISQTDRDKVFSAFERIEHSYSRKQIGTGLGMPLSRRLAEVNGGTLDFESAPSEGSTFWVILPMAEGPALQADEQSKTERVQGSSRAVLLISAAHEESSILSRYLSQHEFSVTAAAGIEEAIHSVRRREYSVVLIDDSALADFETSPVGNLRDEMVGTATPIILMSGGAFNFNVEEYLRSGIDRHIAKPVSLSEVAKICLELSRSEERLVAAGKKSDPGPIMH